MLRRTASLLLPHGALAQQAAACCSLQFSTFLGQTRSRSEPTTTPGVQSDGSLQASSSAAAADGLDLPAGELLSHADSIVSASEAAEAAVFAAVKADSWFGTRAVLDVLSWTHDYMPWFEAVAVSGVVLKLCTVPLTYMTQKNQPKMLAIRTETEKLQKLKLQLAQVQTPVEFDRLSREYTEAVKNFTSSHKGTMVYTLGMPVLGVLQAAVLISHFSAVGSLARAKLPSMTHEGGLWLTDLTLPDPYFGLPLFAAAATLTLMNTSQMADTIKQMGQHGQMMRNMTLIFAAMMIPAGYFAPSAIALMWGCNALLSVLQNAAFGNAGIRRAIGLPPMKTPDGKSMQSSFVESAMKKLTEMRDPSGGQNAAEPPAAAVSSAINTPPPGSRPAVSYLSTRPRRKK